MKDPSDTLESINSKPCLESPLSKNLRSQNWIEFITCKIHRKSPVSGFLIGITLYVIGVVLAIVLNAFENVFAFFKTYPSFHLAILGLSFVFCVYGYGMAKTRKLLLKLEPCFEPSEEMKLRGETYLDFIEKSYKLIVDNRYSLFFGMIWFFFIVWRAYVHYPQPIAGFSSQPFIPHPYNTLEWYILFVFLFVMLVLGTGCWNIISTCICLVKMELLLLPEKLSELKKLTSYILWGVGAWYVCVALSSPVLMVFSPQEDIWSPNWLVIFNPISAVQIFLGIVMFSAPQIALHKAVVRKKDQRKMELEKLCAFYYKNLVESSKKNAINELYKLSVLLMATNIVTDHVTKTKEWVIDFSVITKLISSSIASAAFTTLIPYLLGFR